MTTSSNPIKDCGYRKVFPCTYVQFGQVQVLEYENTDVGFEPMPGPSNKETLSIRYKNV